MSHYWLRMIYRCEGTKGHPRCGYETPFLLEYGCEGPRGPRRGFTPDGKPWVPVPFVAGRCPSCGVGDLIHADWNQDAEISVDGPLEVPHFAYPIEADFKRYGEQACGQPVYAHKRE